MEPNSYPRAGQNAPPGVQAEIERFRALPLQERENKPLLYRLLGDGTPAYKMAPQDADYTDQSKVKGEKCQNCKFAYQKVVNGKYICSQISGEIQPAGWCKLWKPPSKVAAVAQRLAQRMV